MIQRQPRSTRTDTLFHYAPLFRSVEFAGLERIVGARRASEHAHDLDAVIVAPQHPVWAEIEGLLRRMARDIGRKFDAQAAPDLALAVPRIDLLDLKPRAREEEGRGEIGPDRSEEHTSELQSLMRISYAVFCLKKKNKKQYCN